MSGRRFCQLNNFYISGTTSAVADLPMRTKKVNPWNTSNVFPFGFCHEGGYFQDTDYFGAQFTEDEVAFEGTIDEEITSVRLTRNLVVVFYTDNADGDKAKAMALYCSDRGEKTAGAILVINNADSNSLSICRIDDTRAALFYRDDGGSDYLAARIITVNTSTYALTAGTEKELTSAAVDDVGTACVLATTNTIAYAQILTADSACDIVGVNFLGTTFEDPGTPVEFESGATKYPSLTRYADSKVCLVYQDDGASNDPITYALADVSASAVVTSIKAAASIAGATAAATSIGVIAPDENVLMFGWIDSTFGHTRAGTVSDAAVTLGSELQLTSVATLTMSLRHRKDNDFLVAYENDAKSDYLCVKQFSRDGTTLTAGVEDVSAEAASMIVTLECYDSERFVIFFSDDADSDVGSYQYGQMRRHLIDVRSSVASAAFRGFMLSLGKDGIGGWTGKRITGTTNASANTAMGTKPALPWRKNTFAETLTIFKGKGMYVEDDGSLTPRLSGVDRSGKTIDIRSSVTSEAFECYALKVSGPTFTIDMS